MRHRLAIQKFINYRPASKTNSIWWRRFWDIRKVIGVCLGGFTLFFLPALYNFGLKINSPVRPEGGRQDRTTHILADMLILSNALFTDLYTVFRKFLH